jgi:pimeloyl-ACP methyl ester carboxylesterase
VGYRQLPFSGGTIEYVVDGPEDAQDLLLFHPGTPCAAVPFEGLTRAAAAAGMRTAIYSRPGYARSTRRPGRTVADEAPISAALADHLGHERFFTASQSLRRWLSKPSGSISGLLFLPDSTGDGTRRSTAGRSRVNRPRTARESTG